MNYAEDVEHTIGKLHIATKTETDKHILDDAFAALEKSARGHSPTGRDVWQNIFTSKITKYAAVAAVILVVFAMFLNKPAATKAPGRINAALKKAGNVCISTFLAGSSEPYEQEWFSTTLNVKILKSLENNQVQFALLDIPNQVKMQTFLSSNTVQTEPLTDQMLTGLEESMIQNAGLVRYFLKGEIPKDARWKRVDDPEVTAQSPGTKIYELLWQQKGTTAGEMIYRKWRVFADAKTNLPRKAEWYVKSQLDEPYSLESYTVFSYPQPEDIQSLIRNTFGRPGRQPEYIGTPGAY